MFRYITLIIFALFITFQNVNLGNSANPDELNLIDSTINDSGNTIGGNSSDNEQLTNFIDPISSFFYVPGDSGLDGLNAIFTTIAFQIKNFFIAIAIIFLFIGVLKLLFSPGGDEDIKKWRKNIIWVTVGIFVMQIAFSAWNTLATDIDEIDSELGYSIWENIFKPIVGLLQLLAAFAFLSMMIYAFYIIVTGGGDEEKLKKGKTTVIYAIVGFLLIKIPEYLINAIYGKVECSGAICTQENPRLSDGIEIIAKIFNFFNGFLSIICVILTVYAGWLVLISGGEEEKLKKAKNIILYIVIGLLLLVGSHALFQFFILQDVV